MSSRPTTLRLGTRGSTLARAQADRVAEALRGRGFRVEIVVVRTLGDRRRDSRFERLGPPGVFARELQGALLRGELDLAVHSLKDLPAEEPPGLTVAAVLERRDPADVLLYRAAAAGQGLLPLKAGATVGTASARREALLRHERPDLAVRFLRGNVPTRLERLREGVVEALVLAAAGLERLQEVGVLPPPESRSFRLPPERFVPAPGQGALAVETRVDHPARKALATLEDPAARRTTRAERALLRRLGPGCTLPFGAYATLTPGGRLRLRAVLVRNGTVRRADAEGSAPEDVAARALAQLERERAHG